MLERAITITTIASLCLLIITLNVVTPTGIGPFGILIFFGLTYLSLLGVVTYFIFIINRLVVHLASAFTVKKPLGVISFKKACYYGLMISAGPVILLGLQTVDAVGIYEVFLTLLFVSVGCVYISKRAG